MLSFAPQPLNSNENIQSSQSLTIGMPEMPKSLSDVIEENLQKKEMQGEDVYIRNRCPSQEFGIKLKSSMIQRKNGKHLVLDLDETLVHTFEEERELEKFLDYLSPENKKRIHKFNLPGIRSTFWTYVRPNVEIFLEGVFNEFSSVGVWSAGTHDYVHTIVNIIFPSHLRPKYIMSRDNCNVMRFIPGEPVCRYKPLENIFRLKKELGMTQRNTIIVDDRKDICAFNCHNNVQIPAFYIDVDNYSEASADASLLILLQWFQSPLFRNSQDVTVLKGKSPFRES